MERGSRPLQHIGRALEGIPPKSSGTPLDGADQPEESPCPICHGAHFVHPCLESGKPNFSQVVPCRCIEDNIEAERRRLFLKLCELPRATEHMTFDNFEVGPGLEEAFEMSKALAEGSADFNWLTLMSDADRGKTHLGIAIVRHWIAQQRPARYAYVPLLFEELRRGFREEGERSYDYRFEFYLNVPLLMLDDVGTENRTPWVQEKLDTIIDYRLMNDLALVVSTNLVMDELPFRIASRLQRRGKIVVIDAPEYSSTKESRK